MRNNNTNSAPNNAVRRKSSMPEKKPAVPITKVQHVRRLPTPVKKPNAVQDEFIPFDTLCSLSAYEISKLKLPKPKQYWGHHIKERQLGMLVGPRGSGKSNFVYGQAIAMATGKMFLGFGPETPMKVAILDGEMDMRTIQLRFYRLCKSLNVAQPKNLRVISPEFFSGIMPSLSNKEGQEKIDKIIGDCDVVFIDNYSAFSSGREDATAWVPWRNWLLKHKRAGRTVILVHHTGKNGTQRGASNHEDAMDFVMSLRPPKVAPVDGSLQFVVSWTKSRHQSAKSKQPFQATFKKENGCYTWTKSRDVDVDSRLVQVRKMLGQGKTQTEIAGVLGVDKSTISRMLKKSDLSVV